MIALKFTRKLMRVSGDRGELSTMMWLFTSTASSPRDSVQHAAAQHPCRVAFKAKMICSGRAIGKCTTLILLSSAAEPRWVIRVVGEEMAAIDDESDIFLASCFPTPGALHGPGYSYGDDGRDVVAGVLKATFQGEGELG